jgi:ribosomal 30S subunit maturation factor RimM
MRYPKPLALSFSLLAFAGATAYADETKQQKGDMQAEAQHPTQRQADMPWDRGASLESGEVLTSNLRGMQVTNTKGEDIGDISDVIIDLNSGKVHAVVLEFGGILGIGEKNFAFPITELKPARSAARR